MKRAAHHDSWMRDGGRGGGSGSIGASCKYDSKSSGFTTVVLYSAASQLPSSEVPLPAPRSPRFASPISHSSRYAGWARETPNRESLRAGKVQSSSPVGPSIARLARSSSSNHPAIAARAALFHVWRFEKPSSKSPMMFAASSATPLTAPAATFSNCPHARSRAAAARKLPIQIDSRYVEKNSRLGPSTLSRFAYPQ